MKAFKKAKLRLVSEVEYIGDKGLPESESDKTDTTVYGTLRAEGEEITLTYNEKQNGAEILTRIRVLCGEVVLERRGAISSVMIFKEGEHHTSVYSVPPYEFDMALYTKRVKSTLGESGGELLLVYDAEVGGSKTTCYMTVSAVTE